MTCNQDCNIWYQGSVLGCHNLGVGKAVITNDLDMKLSVDYNYTTKYKEIQSDK